MKKTDVLVASMELARTGLAFTPSDAFDCIAALVEESKSGSEDCDWRVERLLKLVACIWSLRRELVAPATEDVRAQASF